MVDISSTMINSSRAIVNGQIWTEDSKTGNLVRLNPGDEATSGTLVIDHVIAADEVNERKYAALVMPKEAAVAEKWAQKTEAIFAARDLLMDDYAPASDALAPVVGPDRKRAQSLAKVTGLTTDQVVAVLNALVDDLDSRAHARRTMQSDEAGQAEAKEASDALWNRITHAILVAAPYSQRAIEIRGE